jgi:hypothetical protein
MLCIPAWLLLPAIMLSGCARFRHEEHSYVYVAARQVYLHDRVAAVSNRVGVVTNGEALEVVERGKRFTKVRTPKGEVGWLEDHAIIDDKLYAQFQELSKNHAAAPVVAAGELRDDMYLHILPGRETPHFLVMAANTKVQLLERGTVAKAPAPGTVVAKPVAPPVSPSVGSGAKLPASGLQSGAPVTSAGEVPPPAAVATVAMEDWWLVRDAAGHSGWLLARQLDVDVPDEVGEYAEGQRMIGAYPIAKVMDSGVEHERKGAKKAGVKAGKTAQEPADDASAVPVPVEHTEYVTVLSPPRGGLPYDFDQVRVFTWSLNHHRYETAYRLHGIWGYLPVRLSQETVNGQAMPVFSFAIADGPDVKVDSETGVAQPATPRMLSFRLEGNLVRRTGADQGPIILTHDSEEPGKSKQPAKKKKH